MSLLADVLLGFVELVIVFTICSLIAIALGAVAWLISSVLSFSFGLTAIALLLLLVFITIIIVERDE